MNSKGQNKGELRTRMSRNVRVRVQWPRGSILPVLISLDETASDLAYLIRFALLPFTEILLFHGLAMLMPDKTLSAQGITNDALIQVLFRQKIPPQPLIAVDKNNPKNNLERKIEDVYRESLRLSDLRLSTLKLSSRIPLEDETEDIQFAPSFEETFIKETTTEIPTDPLPIIWEDYSSDDEDDEPDIQQSFFSRFNSIEEAGHYFAKEKWFGWIW